MRAMRASRLGPRIERVRGWNFTDWGDEIAVDVPLNASLVPGGVINPDALRIRPAAVDFFEDDGPVVISRGVWVLHFSVKLPAGLKGTPIRYQLFVRCA
jgi:protease I